MCVAGVRRYCGAVRGNTLSVQRVINASAEAIFALLADAGQHAAFDGSGTVDHASARWQPLSMGSRFDMAMRGRRETLFLPYRSNNTVIEFEPDRRIAWQTTFLAGLVGGRIWRYELKPAGGATLVKETWDISRDRQRVILRRSSVPQENEDGMRATLGRIAALVEP
jgi:uncharacterized protein YndB with AHSA1/START domain